MLLKRKAQTSKQFMYNYVGTKIWSSIFPNNNYSSIHIGFIFIIIVKLISKESRSVSKSY